LLGSTSGCGRFGFDELETARSAAEATGEPVASGSEGTADPSGPLPSTQDPTSTAPGTLGTPGDSAEPGDAGQGVPADDAGTIASGNGSGNGAGNLFPLPPGVDCARVQGSVACSDFDGSTSGAGVATGSINANNTTAGYMTGMTSGDSEAAHLQTSFSALAGGALYLRFSVFLPLNTSIVGMTLASVGNPRTTDFGVDLDVVRDGELELRTSGDGKVTLAGSFAVPRGRWTCVRVEIPSLSNASGTANVLVDDLKVLSASNLDTLPSGGAVAARAGIVWTFGGQGPLTVSADNFVLATSPLGPCP